MRAVKQLLALGADATLKNNSGETALDLAKQTGQEHIYSILEAAISKPKETMAIIQAELAKLALTDNDLRPQTFVDRLQSGNNRDQGAVNSVA